MLGRLDTYLTNEILLSIPCGWLILILRSTCSTICALCLASASRCIHYEDILSEAKVLMRFHCTFSFEANYADTWSAFWNCSNISSPVRHGTTRACTLSACFSIFSSRPNDLPSSPFARANTMSLLQHYRQSEHTLFVQPLSK
jgi:hypothetical protein